MTSKERMLTAIQNQKPDRTPAAPDMSNMIPARMSGEKFYNIYRYNKPELWRCYIEAVKYFGIDGWFIYGSGDFETKSEISAEETVISQTEELIHTRTTIHTPAGDIYSETKYPADQPPTTTSGFIKNLKEDLPKIKYLFPEITNCRDTTYRQMQKELGELGACGACVAFPGYQILIEYFENKLTGVVYGASDYPDEFEELHSCMYRYLIRQAEMLIDMKPDFLLLGGSGSITLASVKLFRTYALPFIKEVTKQAKEAGIPTMLHSCGKEKDLVKIVAEETDLSCVNPLEIPPMGDCNLRDIKAKYGSKISLMGNLHTTDIMLNGTPKDVRAASLQAIEDAGYNGGFILSTGDQCGRDTPDENIFAMVEAAKEYRL